MLIRPDYTRINMEGLKIIAVIGSHWTYQYNSWKEYLKRGGKDYQFFMTYSGIYRIRKQAKELFEKQDF